MSERLSEYFTQESSEYLDQLERLLAEPGVPDPDEILRLTRGVRGSAEMAGAETIAGVAERLEDAARSILARHVVWSEEIRSLAVQTVRDLQVLIRAMKRWGPVEEDRVRAAIERWDDLDTEGVVPIATLFHDDDGPHVLSAPEETDPDVVAIGSLLFRGDAALREALRLRPEIERLVEQRDGPALRGQLDELFDLLALAAQPETAAG